MNTYTEKSAVKDAINIYFKRLIELKQSRIDFLTFTEDLQGIIDGLADADVVQPIRCKECIHYMPKTSRCWRMCFPMTADDYCSLGERKAE